MRVLVYPHLMEIGGSQLNAIELAARTARRGHQVVVFGPTGPLVPLAESLGLEYLTAPRENSWPSLRNGARLHRIVTTRGVEVVHGYEWGPALDLAFGVEPFGQVGAVTTVLSMSVPHFLPRHSAMVVGTEELRARKAAVRQGPTHLIEPPIDTESNAPRDPRPARHRFGVAPDEVVVAVVCRLTTDLDKLAGVLEAVDVAGSLAAAGLRLRLLAVGDGPGLGEVERRASVVNAALGREVVTVPGALLDPSDAYAAADVVLGMGSSALKGLAFAKPLVVQGAAGYWRPLDENSLDAFLEQGWYGEGGRGAADLTAALRPLVSDAALRARLGRFGRDLVIRRFGLEAATDRLEEIYAEASLRRPDRSVVLRELTRTSYEFAKFRAVRFGQDHVQSRLPVRAVVPEPVGR